ncbi:hypothetical protein [Horticoccus sp. 23ND18S-11]|uniref:hypothetical protein n=1 Tax=Horticoccus sp. 23ND18S-11 TaxID=3391832 RepID=UPI0039C92E6C
MYPSLTKLVPILLGSLALAAQAVPITGQINIQTGSVVLTPNMLGAVSSVGGSSNGLVTAIEGAYPAALVGDFVTYKPFIVAVGAQSIATFWSVTDTLAPIGTGFNYSFDLGAITSVIQTPTNLFVNGAGTLRSNNPALDATPGLWSYGINSADGSPTSGAFSFQSNNVAQNVAVPDGGNSLILFGAGLIGLGGLARSFKFLA